MNGERGQFPNSPEYEIDIHEALQRATAFATPAHTAHDTMSSHSSVPEAPTSRELVDAPEMAKRKLEIIASIGKNLTDLRELTIQDSLPSQPNNKASQADYGSAA